MANQRQQDEATKPPTADDAAKQRPPTGPGRPKPDKQPSNGDVDEGLDETFPASDPPAPSRPTGAK